MRTTQRLLHPRTFSRFHDNERTQELLKEPATTFFHSSRYFLNPQKNHTRFPRLGQDIKCFFPLHEQKLNSFSTTSLADLARNNKNRSLYQQIIMKRAASSSSAAGAKRQKQGPTGSVKQSCAGVTRGFADALRTGSEKYPEHGADPPTKATVSSTKKPLPTRNATTKELTFVDFPEFKPNLTPGEVVLMGSFGGTYFRDIHSAVTKQAHKGKQVAAEFPLESWGWKSGKAISLPSGVNVSPGVSVKQTKFDAELMLHSDTYRTTVNKFGVKCGGSLYMWEGHGWINEIDPYGWFHWYCRFYQGRRSTDDARQVQRWLNSAGPKGRFKNQLMNKCQAEGMNCKNVWVWKIATCHGKSEACKNLCCVSTRSCPLLIKLRGSF
ncbi:unnamed protein product [Amoebophrya sp. A120]|nr:unnamed protein product [Amoebophrya sp. A120]|eukprot:GSA120T00022522001.1